MRKIALLALLPLLGACSFAKTGVGQALGMDCNCGLGEMAMAVTLDARIPADSEAQARDQFGRTLQTAGWKWAQTEDGRGTARMSLIDPLGQPCTPRLSFADGQYSVNIACTQVVKSVGDRGYNQLLASADALSGLCAGLVDHAALYQCHVNKTPR